jgi:hypothetical protein
MILLPPPSQELELQAYTTRSSLVCFYKQKICKGKTTAFLQFGETLTFHSVAPSMKTVLPKKKKASSAVGEIFGERGLGPAHSALQSAAKVTAPRSLVTRGPRPPQVQAHNLRVTGRWNFGKPPSSLFFPNSQRDPARLQIRAALSLRLPPGGAQWGTKYPKQADQA